MEDEYLRLQCLKLSVECFSWFKDCSRKPTCSLIQLADMMYKFIKEDEVSKETFYP